MALKSDRKMTLSQYAAAVGLHPEELARLADVPALTVRIANGGHPIAQKHADKILATLSREHGRLITASDIGHFHTC